jgi:hypothetical protein
MGQIDLLMVLQHMDDEIRAGNKRLAELARLLSGNAEVEAARQQAAATAARLHQLQARHNNLNLELDGLAAKAGRSEQRLYSGLVKNPKELADLQHEVEALGRRRAVLEDEILDSMIALEQAAAGAAADQEQSEVLDVGWEKRRQALYEEQMNLARKVKATVAERERELPLISVAYLAAYQQVVKRTAPPAVVAIRNGRCLGCQVTIPANLIKAAEEGKLVFCDSCTRILCPS